MSHNPYAPPTAPVADIPGTPARANSRDVERACKLIWAAFWVQQVAATPDLFVFPEARGLIIVSSIVGFAIGFLITRWFVSKLMDQRNWMRVFLTSSTVLLVLVILFFWDVTSSYASSPTESIALLIETALYSIAVSYLFTARSRSWFAHGGAAAADPAA